MENLSPGYETDHLGYILIESIILSVYTYRALRSRLM